MALTSWADLTRRLVGVAAALSLGLAPLAAEAQSTGGFVPGQTLTAAELNNALKAKQDYSAAQALSAPINLAPNSQWEIWSGVNWGNALAPNPSATTGCTATNLQGGSTTANSLQVECGIAATGNTVASTAHFYGYISGGALTICSSATVCPGSPVSGTVAIGQYLATAIPYNGSNPPGGISPLVSAGTTIQSGAGTSWTVSGSQTVGSSSAAQEMYGCSSGTGANAPSCGYTTFTTNSIGDLSVGDLVIVTGSGIDSAFSYNDTTLGVTNEPVPMRVTALSAPAGCGGTTYTCTITVRLPRGQTPTVSAAETITPIKIGGGWFTQSATGAGPDGWTRYPTSTNAGPILWRDMMHGNYAVNAPSNVTPYAALGVELQQTNSYVSIGIPANIPGVRLSEFQGKTVVFGAYVLQKKQGGTGTWAVLWNIGGSGVTTCASAPANQGAWQWMECAITVPVSATTLNVGIQFQGSPGDVYYMVDPVLTIGSYIGGVQNYVKPVNNLFVPLVHVASDYWVNQTVTFPTYQQYVNGSNCFCFIFDPYAETGGMIAPTVLKAHGQLEGFDDGAIYLDSGYIRAMTFLDSATAPDKSGSFLVSYVQSAKMFQFMDFPFFQSGHSPTDWAWQGTEFVGTGISADQWKNVSIEMDDFVLQ